MYVVFVVPDKQFGILRNELFQAQTDRLEILQQDEELVSADVKIFSVNLDEVK